MADKPFDVDDVESSDMTFGVDTTSRWGGYKVDPRKRPFIAWDGEGMNLRGDHRPQSYILFGCSTGDKIVSTREKGLNTQELCKFIIDVGRQNPTAWHVGFAFNYDMNMIIQSLSERKLRELHENQYTYVSGAESRYCIRICKGKWFSVSEHQANWERTSKPANKFTVRIYDIFGFFACSFVKAVHSMLGCGADECDNGCVPGLISVVEGKGFRGSFDDYEYVEKYWTVEIELLRQVAEMLRKQFYDAGFNITQWYGPGALASYSLSKRKMKNHMKVSPENVSEAAQHAYAGGRFELYKVGRIKGPVYSYDINSAYPFAISQLPSLQNGRWEYEEKPSSVEWFAVYHVRLRRRLAFPLAPGPLFHRDRNGNISYPWFLEGWYWGPEVKQLAGVPDVEIVEGYIFVEDDPNFSPFSWVKGMYETRRDWKAAGNPNQMALKLTLNSLYGKMAQRVGWQLNENTGEIRLPPWFQLEWAGWVTSYTRATLFNLMKHIPHAKLIAVETDGVYTTMPPDQFGMVESNELGGWSIDRYDEILYVQSGLAWLRQGKKWTDKRRGLDPGTFTRKQCEKYVRSLGANDPWKPYVGEQTRFIGLGAALNSAAPTKVKHCVWETTAKEIVPGEHGKRIHIPSGCMACTKGKTAYEMPHDLVVRSLSQGGEMSYPHYLPWLDPNNRPDWVDLAELEKDMIEHG